MFWRSHWFCLYPASFSPSGDHDLQLYNNEQMTVENEQKKTDLKTKEEEIQTLR